MIQQHTSAVNRKVLRHAPTPEVLILGILGLSKGEFSCGWLRFYHTALFDTGS